jgi:hypothetical protein
MKNVIKSSALKGLAESACLLLKQIQKQTAVNTVPQSIIKVSKAEVAKPKKEKPAIIMPGLVGIVLGFILCYLFFATLDFERTPDIIPVKINEMITSKE